jgi:hypothetical protein
MRWHHAQSTGGASTDAPWNRVMARTLSSQVDDFLDVYRDLVVDPEL